MSGRAPMFRALRRCHDCGIVGGAYWAAGLGCDVGVIWKAMVGGDMAELSEELVRRMHAYWRAANYLTVGQIYLKDNPLLARPLTVDDIKPRLLGHWGTTSGLNFIYT